MYEIDQKELRRGRRLAVAAGASPLLLGGVPLVLTFLLVLLIGAAPPASAAMLFGGLIIAAIGLFIGLGLTAFFLQRRSTWTKEMRERIAADGIKASEIDWFRNELKSNEKRALKAVEARDLLLGDAYRETLASRLTASRIIRLSKRELNEARRRESSLKRLKSDRAEEYRKQINEDVEKISKIGDEAKVMLAEAESRLQMLEAAASRHGSIADSEMALKKLSARTAELPLALEAAKISEEIRRELDAEELTERKR
jgi:hypothetical protein